MAITAATVQAHMETASTAVGNRDYAAALDAAGQAWADLLGLPDTNIRSDELTWDRTSIQEFIKYYEKKNTAAQFAASPTSQVTKINRVAVTG